MKATYLKPTTEMLFLSSSVVMITASDGTSKLVEDGGNTSTGDNGNPITEGDSRRTYNVWEEEEEEEQY